MQVIPTTGIAQGIQYWESLPQPLTTKGFPGARGSLVEDARYQSNSSTSEASALVASPLGGGRERAVVICSMGDASVTEGEVSEAFQVAVLKQLPIIYLVQDNHWGISVSAEESRAMDAYEYAEGFKGMNKVRVDGTDFAKSYEAMNRVIDDVRRTRRPWLVHAKVSLLNHHTSGVRKEFYRTEEDLANHYENDPLPKLRNVLLQSHIHEDAIKEMEVKVEKEIADAFAKAVSAPEPDPGTV